MANPYMNTNANWMSTAPSPYQQQMMSGGSPYARPMAAPMDNTFRDRQAAIGQQLANQPMQNEGGSQGGMGSGIGGGLGSMDPKMMAQGLRQAGAAISPYLPTTQQMTAETYGTNPYSDQSLMLARQNQGLV